MLSDTERVIPNIITLFPGLEERVYFQNPETKEFWFHATGVCKVLGFSNPTSALTLHCDEDEKLMEIHYGRQTWFVSEAGCYGLAMGAKNEVSKNFKRWLKHELLPKLRASGYYVSETATSDQKLELAEKMIMELISSPDIGSKHIQHKRIMSNLQTKIILECRELSRSDIALANTLIHLSETINTFLLNIVEIKGEQLSRLRPDLKQLFKWIRNESEAPWIPIDKLVNAGFSEKRLRMNIQSLADVWGYLETKQDPKFGLMVKLVK